MVYGGICLDDIWKLHKPLGCKENRPAKTGKALQDVYMMTLAEVESKKWQ